MRHVILLVNTKNTNVERCRAFYHWGVLFSSPAASKIITKNQQIRLDFGVEIPIRFRRPVILPDANPNPFKDHYNAN